MNNKKENLDQIKKRVQELMHNTSIIEDNGQFLVVKDLQKDGTYDYLSESFDLANSELKAWQQAYKIITDNLNNEDLYQDTFIVDISDKAKKIHIDYLNELKNDYIDYLDNLSLPNTTTEEINFFQERLDNVIKIQKELKLELNTVEHYIDQSKELQNTLGFDNLDFDNDGLT
ncbi:MAG TPA: hypothetical protein EYG85_05675, partial [Crocinitomix sp.]|nr:hypothetical protein [Crocinitomix sp.]